MTAILKPEKNRSLVELPLQTTSQNIWESKYQLRDKEGGIIDQTVDDSYRRVAKALADLEQTPEQQQYWFNEFLWALRHGAIPAGRILANAGASGYKPATSTINCTVSGTIHDSMDDILAKLHEAGLTLKRGCGIGYEFSTLRPRGAFVAGAGANTSGPLSFMDIYDRMCFTISSAGGRRGAQMATFDIGHPDVMEFIKAKREDGRLRQFNLSLLLTDEFMRCVGDDALWPLSFPLNQKELEDEHLDLKNTTQVLWRDWPTDNGYITNEHGQVACKIYGTVPARQLWDEIMASTYDYAEPGFVLIDRVNEMNNNWFCENIRASNPCVSKESWVHTDEGPRQVSQLLGKPFTALIDGEKYISSAEGFFKTATKPVVKLQTIEGFALRLTIDHRVRRVTGYMGDKTETEWCETGKLIQGDRILLNDHRAYAAWAGKYGREEGYLIGLLVGDGTLKEDKAVLSVWKPGLVANSSGAVSGVEGVMTRAEAAARTLPHRSDFNGWMTVPGRNEYRLSPASIKHLAAELGMKPGSKGGSKMITAVLEQTSSEFYRGFLRGIFDADGSVQGSQQKGVSIRLAQSKLDTLQSIQRMLLRLGIYSKIYKNRREPEEKFLPDGKGGRKLYQVKAQHELVVSGENIIRFNTLIGFADSDKQARLEQSLSAYQRALNRERFVARVESIVEDGIEDVFDVQIPGINAFDANGLYVHNCGEQPLPAYGACLLGSINLPCFVQEPFTDKASFDWEGFRKVVRIFTRMLDNVVEIHGLPLPGQEHEIMRKRRHGMGFLGLGSVLTLLCMKYGGPESLQFARRLSRDLALTGWEAGLELAREKGPAPIMDEEFVITEQMLALRPEMRRDGHKAGDRLKGKILHARYSRYMQRVAEVAPELVDAIAEAGARFTHHSSIAPTGTIALSFGNNVSNGIEPSFAHHYCRNVIRPDRKTKESMDVYSYELLAYKELIDPQAIADTDNIEHQLPAYFVTTNDVTPQQHIEVQAAVQEWIDSSISKTVNVPADFPYESFQDIYKLAHQRGLKGCTTFRYNPEVFQGVLVKKQDMENTIYYFTLEDGQVIAVKGDEEIEYDGERHTAANLFEALKEGYYDKH